MDEAARIERIEAGKKLLQQRRNKKSKVKRKKGPNPGNVDVDVDVSLDVESSVLDDSVAVNSSTLMVSVNDIDKNPQQDGNGPTKVLSNPVPGTSYGVESDLMNFNDGLESMDSAQDPAIQFLDDWDRHHTHHVASFQPDNHLPMPDGTTDKQFNSSSPEPPSRTTNLQSNSDLEAQLRDSQMAQLQNQVIMIQNEKKQVVNELNSLRESQFDTLERTKRDISSNCDLKLANLQQALVEKEQQLHAMEQRFIDTEHAHNEQLGKHLQECNEREQKYASTLSEHEKMHAEMLSERDRRHAEHIARLASEQAELPDAERDSGELEAERLRMIKEKLKELHEDEKKRMISEHVQEKQRLQAEFQKKFEDYRKQAVDDANSQLKNMHERFMEAHQVVENKEKAMQDMVASMTNEINDLKDSVEKSQLDNVTLEEKYQRVLESHSAEIELERKNSITLEIKLQGWTEKAARLEADLAKSESQIFSEADTVQEDKAISQLSSEYESKIHSLQSLVEECQVKLRESESQHQQELSSCQTQIHDEYLAKLQEAEDHNQRQVEEIIAKYEEQLVEVRSQHDILEASVSEFASEKGSLEVAEEHMTNLQEELNKYRNKEKNVEARLTDLKQQHMEDISVLRMQLESEKAAAVEVARKSFSHRFPGSNDEFSVQIEQNPGASLPASFPVVDRKGVAEVEAAFKAKKDAALQDLQEMLQASHRDQINRLNQQKATEIEALKANFELEIVKEREETQRQVTGQMEALMRAHTEQLQAEHETQVAKLRQSLVQAKKEAKAKLEGLKAQVSNLSSEKANWESVQKDLMSQMELLQRQREELKQNLSRTEVERNKLSEDSDRFQKQVKSLEVDVSISRSTEEQNRLVIEQNKQILEKSQIALVAKEDDLTNLRAELEELENQVECLREEKQTLEDAQQQFWDQMGAKNKTISDLQAAKEERMEHSSHVEEDSADEVSVLKENITRLMESETFLKRQLSSMETKLEAGSEMVAELEEAIRQLRSKLGQADSICEKNVVEIDEMNCMIKELNSQVVLSKNKDKKHMAEIAGKDQHIRELDSKLASTLNAGNKTATEIEKMNHIIADLQSQMTSIDAEKSQIIHEQEQTIEDLEARLTLADTEMTDLQAEKSQLELDLLQSQANPDSFTTNLDAELEDLAQKHSDLQRNFEEINNENTKLIAEVDDLRANSATSASKSADALEEKIKDQEQTIEDLRAKLTFRGPSIVQPFQSDQEYSRSPLEATLSRARQTLMDKLKEKSAIENELGIRRATLERQKAEKQHLEDLLFEKKRFEQELQNQKVLLQSELEGLENRLSRSHVSSSSKKEAVAAQGDSSHKPKVN